MGAWGTGGSWSDGRSAESPFTFLLWVPTEGSLRFHGIRPRTDEAARTSLEAARQWLEVQGRLRGLWAAPLAVDTRDCLAVPVPRTELRAARRLLDAAADRFGLSWFDPERDEMTLGVRFGATTEICEALEAVARGGEGWVLYEPVDQRGPFVELGLDAGEQTVRSEVPERLGGGQVLGRASRAQLRLLGWDAADARSFRTELGLTDPDARARAAEIVVRTLAEVYGVHAGEPMALRYRTEGPGPDAA